MLHRLGFFLLTILVASFLLPSCSKTYSSDAPLPISYSPSVIASSDNQVWYAFDPVSGKKHWEFSTPIRPIFIPRDFSPSAVLYYNSIYIVTTTSDTIYKIDSKTGVLIKKLLIHDANGNVPGFTVTATPIVDGNLLYVATLNNMVYAVDTGTALISWSFTADAPIESSPTIYNGQVYIATTGGRVYAIDKTNGPGAGNIPTWEYPGADIAVSPAKFVSSPAIYPPYLYVGSISDSNMYCIFLNPPSPTTTSSGGILDGQMRWTFKTQGGIYSSPATIAGKVIFGSNDFKVYCLDTSLIGGISSPRVYWKDSTNSQVWSSPIVYNQIVYIAGHDYKLYAIDFQKGKLKWEFHSNGLIKSSPVAYGSNIYIGSYDKNLYAVDTAHGTLKWTQNINGNIESSPIIDDLTGANFHKGYNSQVSGLVN